MRYFLEPHPGLLAVLQQGYDEFYVGYVYPQRDGLSGYSVRDAGNNEFSVVQSLEDAIAAIAVLYNKYPPWWDRPRARRRTRR